LKIAPLAAVLFLLSISAIDSQQLREGTLGANNLIPIDIVMFALTLSYVSSSIDAAGFIKWTTLKVMRSASANVGHRLFFYIYIAIFLIGLLFGNDPVIQMGMLFLTYMTRASSNIAHSRAWIHTQFALANIASAVLVSSKHDKCGDCPNIQD
jgi:Na+/H+ antiporter NhaD/arsenite permease-like protein